MAQFWQISGRQSHIRRDWTAGKAGGNAKIAETIFDALSVKSENGLRTLTLILGIESSGASQILLPYHWRHSCRHLDWASDIPYLGSRFASLSPIHIDTHLRLQVLLEERQHAGITKASKLKEDNSKANGRFCNAPPNPSRAAFEHSRCLWKIIQNEFHPSVYGLPEAPWCKHVAIFSLALNFWIPDGIHSTSKLIDASLTKSSTRSNDSVDGIGPTWYFIVEESKGLHNSFQAQNTVVQETWRTVTLPQVEIGGEIQTILNANQPSKDSPASLILLLHDYPKVKDHLATLEGLHSHQWATGVKRLLNFDRVIRQFKKEPYTPSRKRSCSPRGPSSSSIIVKRGESPDRQELKPFVYVVDTLEMFKAATKSGAHLSEIRPVHAFNTIVGRNEDDTWCAGDDSCYILQSWKGMVQGPSVDEQRTLFGCDHSTEETKEVSSDIQGTDYEPPEAENLHEIQKEVCDDIFGDGPDTDSGEEWDSFAG